ncbi:unnamed protein product [Darwinula stevensoni]|uniref:Zinc phosphodiesterase ELAC protein 2 n=1 Tax=Darwinula stevensoni TaxID=69355 RepID=A0A7R8WYW3_9CRUS|nr:unnamed protein product [Darwinula stevensoni]CAG0879837.1 unnamed protein product [Darwinula stevensoni]
MAACLANVQRGFSALHHSCLTYFHRPLISSFVINSRGCACHTDRASISQSIFEEKRSSKQWEDSLFSRPRSPRDNFRTCTIDMPEDRSNKLHRGELRAKVLKRRAEKSLYPPAEISLHIIGSGAFGAPRALYMLAGNSSYLFNCGEGAQRLLCEHKMKLGKLEHILVTHLSWENYGGLPGLLLSLHEMGLPSLTLHGPPDVEKLIERAQSFVKINAMEVLKKEYSDVPYEDETLIISYVPIWGGKKEKDGFDDSDLETTNYCNLEGRKRRRLNTHNNAEMRGSGQEDALKIKERDMSVAYICRLKPRAGSLLLEKCLDYKVPTGPLLGCLKRGEDVTLENGTVVHSQDVMSPQDPGSLFFVVDCPTEAFLKSLMKSGHFQSHMETSGLDPSVIFHFTPPEVMGNLKYQDWMSQFPKSTIHISLNRDSTCLGNREVYRNQFKLNSLDPVVFPLLKEFPSVNKNEAEILSPLNGSATSVSSKVLAISATDGVVQARTLTQFRLRPKMGLDFSSSIVISSEEALSEIPSNESDVNVRDRVHESVQAKRDSDTVITSESQDFPRILFLGTGSSVPQKTRNTSAILFTIKKKHHMMLDCGEGTLGQLVRFFGLSKTWKILTHLNATYISHLHADHHIGLISILQAREEAFMLQEKPFQPMKLFAPQPVIQWLDFYNMHFESIDHLYQAHDNALLLNDNETMLKNVLESLGLRRMQTCRVSHCPDAFGVSLTDLKGWTTVYSGDTRPCNNLVFLGMDCDLLIHEATMEDDMVEAAHIKAHSTVSQALDIAERMQSKHIILTHFSQRYCKIPILSQSAALRAGIAFDFMQGNCIPMDLPSVWDT